MYKYMTLLRNTVIRYCAYDFDSSSAISTSCEIYDFSRASKLQLPNKTKAFHRIFSIAIFFLSKSYKPTIISRCNFHLLFTDFLKNSKMRELFYFVGWKKSVRIQFRRTSKRNIWVHAHPRKFLRHLWWLSMHKPPADEVTDLPQEYSASDIGSSMIQTNRIKRSALLFTTKKYYV